MRNPIFGCMGHAAVSNCVTWLCVAVDQSGIRLKVVMRFLGHARYNTWTNEHVASLMCISLDTYLTGC